MSVEAIIALAFLVAMLAAVCHPGEPDITLYQLQAEKKP